ncbi:ABC transporter permease [Aquimarina litoralis]|uniref:ABC transporter permease n=1 Tax=Aquimarina litoralis TaxID=584605 RepID=UPI001C57D546|nr:ABC transporter permease [Aquimarina litoralis]MBW1299073.1 FtsX-like permease family protein [Aquimarina litoralis]
MIKHIFLIAIRNLKKNKISFLINTVGLSTGLACVILIFLWIQDEQNVDTFHQNQENLYQVMGNFEVENKIITMDNTSFLLGESLVKEFPEVTSSTVINADFITPKGIFSDQNTEQLAQGIFASPNFFENFSFDLLIGETKTVLDSKKNVVLSEELATKLFNSPENAIGKTLDWDYKWSDGEKKVTVQVSGVFKDIPDNSTLQFDAVVHSDLLKEASRWVTDWKSGYAKVFLLLKEGTDIDNFNKKIAKYLSTKVDNREMFTLFTQKFSERYLKGTYENGIQTGGRIVYIRLFAIIAFLILLIACINFMNLSTAQASKRLKEIGIKKVLGGRQKALIFQFIGESFVLTFISLIVAIGLVILLLPFFNQITAKQIQLIINPTLVISLIGLLLITGLLAGSYPAFYLAKFQPVFVLKGKLLKSFGDIWIRKGLVIVQFTLAIIFIIGVSIVNNQMHFVMQKNLGYERNHIITFPYNGDTNKLETFINEIQHIPGVVSASFMNGSILDATDGQGGFDWGGDPSDKNIMFHSPRVGYEFTEVMGIELLEGRRFSKEFNDDYNKIILNASAAKLMGLQNPVGTIIDKSNQKMEIIGVVADFQYGSLHKKLEPLILRFRKFGSDIVLKLNGTPSEATIDQIASLHSDFQPGYPFEFSFLDTEYQQLYEAENKVASLSKIFTLFVILISCLGLLGLTIFNAEQRRKEIGVRKILGASVMGIVKLLSKDFLKLVLIAIVVAIPIGWLLMNRWLQDFAYRIHIDWWIFVIAGLVAILIAFVTISIQAIKTALANPTTALRSE